MKIEKINHISTLSFRKKMIYSLILLFCFLIIIELLSFLVLHFRGATYGDMAFHTAFRKRYKFWATTGAYLFDPFLCYRNAPNKQIPEYPFKNNEHGFVDNGNEKFPDLFNKPQGVFRIFIFGGSTVYGSGCSSNSTTIAAQMEKMLNESCRGRFEVINAGVDGYFSFNELGYFISDIVNYHPDLVIFYDGWNDCFYACLQGGFLNEYQKQHMRYNYHEYALYLSYMMPQFFNPPLINLHPLWSRTYTTILLLKVLKRINPEVDISAYTDIRALPNKIYYTPKEAAQLYADIIRSAVGVSQAHKVKIIYALQPTILNKQFFTPEEEKLFTRKSVLPYKERVEKVRAFYRFASQEYERLAEEFNCSNVRIANLSDNMWLGVKDRLYWDECHVNDLGNKIIATKLIEHIDSILPGR